MADSKISDLAAASSLLQTDKLVIARAGATKSLLASLVMPQIVTALPDSPTDNDEVYLQVGTGDTARLWHMKYDGDITDAYKWRFLGGSPLYSKTVAQVSTSSATFVTLGSSTPQVTLPGIGVYEISHGVRVSGGTSGRYGIQGVQTNGTVPANDDDAIHWTPTAANKAVTCAHTFTRTVSSIATSALAVAVYRTDASDMNFFERWVSVRPIRLGDN